MFWRWFHKKYGNQNIRQLNFPIEMINRFDFNYFLYDKNGYVKYGAKTIFGAIKKSKQTGLYISKCWN